MVMIRKPVTRSENLIDRRDVARQGGARRGQAAAGSWGTGTRGRAVTNRLRQRDPGAFKEYDEMMRREAEYQLKKVRAARPRARWR